MVKNDVPAGGLRARRPPAAGDRARGDGHGARRRALADRLRARRDATSRVVAASQRRVPDHAQGARHRRSCWTTATSGCARSRQHAILRVRAEVVRACRDYFDEHGFIGFDAPIFTPAACEGTTTLFEVDYFGETAYLTQCGQLYGEAGAHGVRQGLLLRPDVPRREVEDAPAPDRVLDGRAGGGVRRPRRRHGPRRGLPRPRRRPRARARARAELRVLERDLAPLERVQKPFPRITLRRGDRAAARSKGVADRVGRRLRRRRGDRALAASSTGR